MRTTLLVLVAVALAGCDGESTIPTVELCGNGSDDDGDGDVDCADSDCVESCVEICDDAEDNNGDGLIDCDDPTCVGGCAEVCDDERDNDGDGDIDCDDRDCSTVCVEDCMDGADNDADGLVDCEDPDCSGACPEQCDNGLDDDDDMLVDCADPDCESFCDADGDGDPAIGKGGADCDDNDPLVFLGAVEACDGIDNDCDGLIDDLDPSVTGDVQLYQDADGDGFGIPDVWALRCAVGNGWTDDTTDCDDTDPTVSPGSPEVPGDRIDQNCNGFEDCYADGDNDSFGHGVLVDEVDGNLRCAPVAGAAANDGDCDDTDSNVFPGAPIGAGDIEDGVDRDCDGFDECFRDNDGDGHGQAAAVPDDGDGTCDDLGESDSPFDCADNDPMRHPDAIEIVGDGFDSNCTSSEDCYFDQDNDGLGSNTVVPDIAPAPAYDCDALPQGSSNNADCDDTDPTATVPFDWLTDGDSDSFGAGAPVATSCVPPDPYVVPDIGLYDCDDADPLVFPGATLGPADVQDGVDRDCDGFEECFVDGDGDGYGRTVPTPDDGDGVCDDTGEASVDGDCADGDPSRNPGATELIGDFIDSDCTGAEDCYLDADDDTYGSMTVVPDAAPAPALDCDAIPMRSSNDLDCDDADPLAFDVVDWLTDGDGDGYGAGVPVASSCTPPDPYVVRDIGMPDCNDANPAIHPGANDPEGDPEDTNCDGHPGMDGDGDGFGLIAAGGTDCDDTDPATYPGATTVCYDGIDNDCAGGDEWCDTAAVVQRLGQAIVDVPGDRFDGLEVLQFTGGRDIDDDGIIDVGSGQLICEWTWTSAEWKDTPGSLGPDPFRNSVCQDNPLGQPQPCTFAFTATQRDGRGTAGNCDLFSGPLFDPGTIWYAGRGYHENYRVLFLTYGAVVMAVDGGNNWFPSSQQLYYNTTTHDFQYQWSIAPLDQGYFP